MFLFSFYLFRVVILFSSFLIFLLCLLLVFFLFISLGFLDFGFAFFLWRWLVLVGFLRHGQVGCFLVLDSSSGWRSWRMVGLFCLRGTQVDFIEVSGFSTWVFLGAGCGLVDWLGISWLFVSCG